jgi:hypothetical protein
MFKPDGAPYPVSMLPLQKHPLLASFLDAAAGRFPAVDGGVSVVAPLPRGFEAVVGFTGHAVLATALDATRVQARGANGFGGALAPAFLSWLAGPSGTLGTLDATLVARGRGGGRLPQRFDLDTHPRVALARRLRSDVEVYADERGVLTLSHGLAGRRELSIQANVEGQGHGRSLLEEGLALVSRGEPVFAAIAPGNARSLRAFLALGFTPLGCEVIYLPQRESLDATT